MIKKMARAKLRIPGKRYRVKEKEIHREGYTRKDGTYVEPTTYTRKAQVIGRRAHKREDLGKPGRGPKLIKVTKGGMVSPAGEYHVSLPAVQRHRILKSLITKEMRTRDKTRDQAELAVYRRLVAMRTLFKNTQPDYARIINEDMEYFKKNFTGANRKMAYPKAAVTKWKSMSHAQRVRARKKGKRR